MTRNLLQTLKEAVYAILLPINENTSPSYPASLWDAANPPKWPLTVYEVEIESAVTLRRRDRRVRVVVTVDHFGPSRNGLSEISARSREALLTLLAECTLEKESMLPGRVFRRSQRYTGLWDVESGIVYE